jgi:hypothetical protein
MLRQARKRLSMWLILLVVTSVASVVVVLLSAVPAPSAPTIIWAPAAVTVTLTPGVSTTRVVSFTSAQNLTDVTVRVVPALAPLVQVTPAALRSIPKGQPTTLTLTIAAPVSALPGTVAGTIQLRMGRGPQGHTLAPPLPVTLTVLREGNTPPVADAGPDQTVFVTHTVQLDGSGSTDPDGDAVTFIWSFVSRPQASAATLSDATVVNPRFVADLPGLYEVQLIVNDGIVDSVPTTVVISAIPLPNSEVLEPGGQIVGVDGFAVGAVAGAISSPVNVVIARTVDPTPQTPLPYGVSPTGHYYQLGAQQTVFTPPDTPFVLGLPVPAGVSLDHLAIAVLVPGDLILDGDGDSWALLDGLYDPDHQLLLGALSVLLQGGLTVTVVSSEEFTSRAATSTAPLQGSGSVPALQRLAASAASLVEVKCSTEFRAPATPETCGPTDEASAATAFQSVHDAMAALGFKSPRLYRRFLTIGLLPPRIEYGPYKLRLRPCSMTAPVSLGLYDAVKQEIWVCIDHNGFGPAADDVLRHEYFHAIQYAYGNVYAAAQDKTRTQWERLLWFIEGQATAAAFSGTHMARETAPPVRVIDFSLLDDKDLPGRRTALLEYRAQDFWVYLGRRLGRGLDYLIPFLEEGPLPADVDETLRDEIGSADLPDLGTAFWEWSKNQVYEKTLDLGNQVLGPSCEFNIDVTTADGLVYDPHNLPPSSSPYPLNPLASRVVKVMFEAPASYTAYVQVQSPSPDVRVKAYEDGKPDCQREPESRETRVDIQQGTPKSFYVLFSNTGFSQAVEAQISVVPLRVTLSPATVTLRGSATETVAGAFTLSNLSSKPVSYSARPSANWLSLTSNAAGTLAPNAPVVVDFTAICPTSGGNSSGTVELEFRSESGVVLTDNNVPKRVMVNLDCSADCSRFIQYPQVEGMVSFSWPDSVSESSNLVSNDLKANYMASGAVVLGGGGAWSSSFGSISGVSSTVKNSLEHKENTTPPRFFTITEAASGPPSFGSFVTLSVHSPTCRARLEMMITAAGQQTRDSDTGKTVKDGDFGFHVQVVDIPLASSGATEISGMMPIPFTGRTIGTYFDVPSDVTSNMISIKQRLGKSVNPALVSWSFTFIGGIAP